LVNPANNEADFVSAPADYDEFYRRYFEFFKALARKHGIDEQRIDDVASDIMTAFIAQDYLAKFDPTLVLSYRGEDRQARFKSFAGTIAVRYLQGMRDRQTREKFREVAICDAPWGKDDGGADTWIEHQPGFEVDGHEEDVLDRLAEAELVGGLRDYLALFPPRNKYDTLDLVALFDAVVEQIREFGEWNIRTLTDRFSVSTTTMHTWLWILRTEACTALGKPVPAKRPRSR
jgi:DNA-directed RNA polymerase specialized sigma24 family protein